MIMLSLFLLIMIIDRRTLWSGFTFLMALGSLGFYTLFILMVYISQFPDSIISRVLIYIGLIGLFLFFLIPFILLIFYFIEGINILKKEGFHYSNLLSLFFVFAILLLVSAWFNGSIKEDPLLFKGYAMIEISAFYLLFIMSIYVVSAILNLIHIRKKHNFQYIVVLGCAIFKDKVPPLLASRVEKGIELYRKNPDSILIFSGGQGQGEDMAEAEAMAEYALKKGVDPSRILIENQSKDTYENLMYSRMKMEEPVKRVAIVTTSYHVFRALILAKKQGIRCVGYGSQTKWYFTLNALIREFIGYLSIRWKIHGFVLLLIVIFIGII